jgi:hypothetical protein
MAMAAVVGDGNIIDICGCFAAALENDDLAMELAAVVARGETDLINRRGGIGLMK